MVLLLFSTTADGAGRLLDPGLTVDTLPAAAALLPSDVELSLRDQGRTADFVAVLLAQPVLATVTGLDLSGNPLGPAGGRVFARAGALPSLAELNLSGTGLDDDGAAALGGADLPVLRVLLLDQCGIGKAGARGLSRLRGLATVTRLSVAGTADLWDGEGEPPFLGPRGMAALVDAPMGQLSELRVPLNGIGDGGARALAHAVHLGALQRVDLRGNEIGDAGALALMAAPHLQRVAWMVLRDNPISAEVKDQLRAHFSGRVVV